MPLANTLPTEEELATPETRYPLEVVMCITCSLLQLTESVPPPTLFAEYAYFSSSSEPIVAHAGELVEELRATRDLDGTSLVVEVASNDGYLLQHYIKAGIPVLGIDPAENVVAHAMSRGVPTLCEFFTTQLAENLRAEGRRADVIHANNVLAHVPDINDFTTAIARLLADDGVAVVETPYVRDLSERLEFDTIYHEHIFYYSLRSLEALFERNGLTVVHVDRIPMHGGSLRLQAVRGGTPDYSVLDLRDEETRLGMGDHSYYLDLATRVDALIASIRSFLADRRATGRRIAGYGAAAKATVMLNALGVGPETIEFVVDGTPYKQGRYVPGVRVPIVAPRALLERKPDDVMIFAWNFATSIIDKEAAYRRAGGTFLLPLPEPHVV
jgi:SAM-dependent methyltransferase